MLFAKTSLMIATTILLANTHGARSLDNKNAKPDEVNRVGNVSIIRPQPSPTPQKGTDDTNSDIKVLAEGSHSEVTAPFLIVARDAQVYAKLRQLVMGLPELQEDFFKSNAVIAAFLGERNTGGYGVAIARADDSAIHVVATSPPRDAMVAQVITTPFKVVSVVSTGGKGRIPSNVSLALRAEDPWQETMRTYRITAGEFTMSGGFAGLMEKFALAGDIRVMREGKLATFVFNLKSTGAGRRRTLNEAATGVVEDGNVTVGRMGAGSLIEMPHSDLSAGGTLDDKNDKLALSFKSLPSMIADGYGGGGSVQAETTTEAPQKNQ